MKALQSSDRISKMDAQLCENTAVSSVSKSKNSSDDAQHPCGSLTSVHLPPPAGKGLRPKEWGRWYDGDGGRAAKDEGARHEQCLSKFSTFSKWVSLHILLCVAFYWCGLTSLCWKVDTNKDRLVSLDEFLKSTEKKEFNNPKEWEVKRLAGKIWVVKF